MICEAVWLRGEATAWFREETASKWTFKSLMSEIRVKSPVVGKKFPVYVHTGERRGRTQKKDGDEDEKSCAWKTHPAEVHKKRKEAVIVIIFPLLFRSW